jgi:8-amino-7-oxononanoate synthase
MTGFPRHARALESLTTRGRRRVLAPRAGNDFASNDYLGLAESRLMRNAARAALDRGVPVGAGGSRLLRGNAPEHEALEAEAAAFFGAERALFMGGGFVANTALFATLPLHGDLVLHDELIHASAHDGMRLGRAETRSFPHNDVTGAKAAIAAWRAEGGEGQVWIAVESVYSMDGDFAPVAELMSLAEAEGAVLVVDEAHATGLWGPGGRGRSHDFADRSNLLSLHTCGKGLGVSGALICGHGDLIDTLVNKARGFIFATAPSPLNAALVRAALAELDRDPDLSRRAVEHVQHAHGLAQRLCGLSGFDTQILPVILGDDKRALAAAAALQARGHDIRAIRPPTVPRGTSRLRISITLNVDSATLGTMFRDLADVLSEVPA